MNEVMAGLGFYKKSHECTIPTVHMTTRKIAILLIQSTSSPDIH